MNIGEAIEAAKGGARISRPAWHGKGMWVQFHAGYAERVAATGEYIRERAPYLEMVTPTGVVQAGWLASQPDLLATDWVATSSEDTE